MTNLVEPIKSNVVGLIPVRIMLTNQLLLFNLLFFSAPFQTLYAPKAVSTKCSIKALKLPSQGMIQLDLPQISLSISHKILAGSANAQFGKTQFCFRHPVYFHLLIPFVLCLMYNWTQITSGRLTHWQRAAKQRSSSDSASFLSRQPAPCIGISLSSDIFSFDFYHQNISLSKHLFIRESS